MEKTNEHKILRMIYLIMMITLITYPKYAIAGGHPAKVFSSRDKDHYEKLKKEGKFH